MFRCQGEFWVLKVTSDVGSELSTWKEQLPSLVGGDPKSRDSVPMNLERPIKRSLGGRGHHQGFPREGHNWPRRNPGSVNRVFRVGAPDFSSGTSKSERGLSQSNLSKWIVFIKSIGV